MRIGTRGSQLALWQAREVARRIQQAGGPMCEIVIIRTSGDEPGVGYQVSGIRHEGHEGHEERAGHEASTKATFVKEIEDALLDGRVDLGVHSSKDLSATLPSGLTIGAALPREDARDAMVLPGGETVADFNALARRLGPRPRLGTSSVRRAAELGVMFGAATFVPVRGNVDTRLRKLDAGDCDAIVLAAAGLKRLGAAARISFALPLDLVVPAPGQGIVSIELREDAREAARAVDAINDRDAMDALTAERAVVHALGGGCQMPLGAHAQVDGDELAMATVVIALDGSRVVRYDARGQRADAARLGQSVAQELLGRGAGDILGSGT